MAAVASAPEAANDAAQSVAFKRDYEERAKEFQAENDDEARADPLFTADAAAEAAAAKAEAKKVEADRRAKAIMQGYTGNMCPECSNFTMVRNGTCEKCDTCGSTSGCS